MMSGKFSPAALIFYKTTAAPLPYLLLYTDGHAAESRLQHFFIANVEYKFL